MSVLFLGTSSGAGKTTVAAMYCRHLHRKGVAAAPFKASNLSMMSFAAPGGGLMGMGQAFQAWALDLEPVTDMNPILLMPKGGGKVDVLLHGEFLQETSDKIPMQRERIMGSICASHDRLYHEYGMLVCEGSGSPAELNLMDRDMANVGLLKVRPMPAVLVGDIERGGVFAALYGTWRLIPEGQRHLLKGFIINRFRGDPSILKSGTDRLEELTGMKCLGVLPRLDLRFPEEDSMSEDSGGATKTVFLENLDILLDEAVRQGFDFDGLDEISSA